MSTTSPKRSNPMREEIESLFPKSKARRQIASQIIQLGHYPSTKETKAISEACNVDKRQGWEVAGILGRGGFITPRQVDTSKSILETLYTKNENNPATPTQPLDLKRADRATSEKTSPASPKYPIPNKTTKKKVNNKGDTPKDPNLSKKMIVKITPYSDAAYSKAIEDRIFKGTFSDFANYCIQSVFESRSLTLAWVKTERIH